MAPAYGAKPTWSTLARHSPDGLALVAEDGRFLRVNQSGQILLGHSESALAGTCSPFILSGADDEEPAAPRLAVWARHDIPVRELSYSVRRLPAARGCWVVAFHDITRLRNQQRRLTAIGRGAGDYGTASSPLTMLDSIATQMVQDDALAAVQIVTVDGYTGELRLTGSAGLNKLPDFFDRLQQCQRLGARLYMLDVIENGEPVVVSNRSRIFSRDPAWRPIANYYAGLDWDWFGSFPLIARGQTLGVLNAFFAPMETVDDNTRAFVSAMAEQAAIAVDYAALLQQEREGARRDERQRIARDLHDSLVQQMFSIRMHAQAVETAGLRGTASAAELQQFGAELKTLSQLALADLRAMVHELRPVPTTPEGLEEAIAALAQSTTNRTGIRFRVTIGRDLGDLATELADDVFRIVSEAVHNAVKHAEPNTITVRVRTQPAKLVVLVSDDGSGPGPIRSRLDGGVGVTAMRERAQRWGGLLTIRAARSRGTVVRAEIPLSAE